MEAMFADATLRFSRRVDTYVRYRPGYPTAVVDLLAAEAHLGPESQIADIGSGTGLLSRVFLDAGYRVTGVEPNREMREAGDTLLSACSGFQSVSGTAEETTLPDCSIDLATAAQAFHWFRVPEARREFRRILRPRGLVALIWNERHIATPFMQECEALIDRYSTTMDPDGAIREGGRSRIPEFFTPSEFRLDEFPNQQLFTLDGLVGRIASCSFIPGKDDPGFPEMVGELEEIFRRYQNDGVVPFEYRTKVFHGHLD